MLRHTVDQLSLASRTRSFVAQRYPDETVLLSSAATILETDQASPVGWSLSRFFQRRGNVVITDARVVIESSFVSLFTIIWMVGIAACVMNFLQSGSGFSIVLAIVGVVFLIQRRPYFRDLPFRSIRRVYFGSARGITGRGDILSIVLDRQAVQLVTAQFLPQEVRERLASIGTVIEAQSVE